MALALGGSFARLNAGSASVKRMFRGSTGVWNADAADWIKRVEANSGSVSTATANAVTNFCNAIDAAGIRDRFYRLNLFCGTGLNACLVPLYRGPSLSGTQYGNTADTNNGPFVSDDYVETGASGGLTGNGSSKYLDTGISQRYPPTESNRHLAVYAATRQNSQVFMGSYSSVAPIGYYEVFVSAAGIVQFYSGGNLTSVSGAADDGFWIGSGTASRVFYLDGVSVGTSSAGADSASGSTLPFFVFCRNADGSPSGYTNSRLCGYSIGLSMTATQAAAYNSSMQTFQTALGRNV